MCLRLITLFPRVYVLSAVASNTTVSDPVCARKLGNASWGVSIAGIIVSVLTIIIVTAVLVSAANSAASSYSSASYNSYNVCPSSYYYVGGSCYKYRTYYGSSYYYYSCDGYYYKSYCYYN